MMKMMKFAGFSDDEEESK